MLPYDIDTLTWQDFNFYWTRNILLRRGGEWTRANIGTICVEKENGLEVSFSGANTLGDIERRGGLMVFEQARGFEPLRIKPSELFESRDILTYTPPLGYMLNAETQGLLYLECTASRCRNRGLDLTRIRALSPITDARRFLGLLPMQVGSGSVHDHEVILDSIVSALNDGHPTGLADEDALALALRPEARDKLIGLLGGNTDGDYLPEDMPWLVWTPSLAIVRARPVEGGRNAIVYLRGTPWATLTMAKGKLTLSLPEGQAGNTVFTHAFFSHIKDLEITEVPSDNSNN
jgi:hypothetical protein